MKDEIISIATDLSEVGLDSALDEGLLKDIPVVGVLLNILKTSHSIRNYILLKNISKFLAPFAEIPKEERAVLVGKFEKEKCFKKRATEMITVYLDRYDNNTKAEYLGIIFIACLKESISNDEFLRIASILDKVYWNDIPKIKILHQSGPNGIKLNYSELQLGEFVRTDPVMLADENDVEGRNSAYFSLTPIGVKFYEVTRK